MKAKYKTKALQKELLKSEIKFLYSDYFYDFFKFSLLNLVKDMWNKFLSIKVFPTHKMGSKLHNVTSVLYVISLVY